ncbi:uncharacterized protein [Polyergus mexicanus]|uniref:uncharacterized protein n=1 Tax=Polyergus mexicanus TaxID=615972 RepID=UPI0038B5FC52
MRRKLITLFLFFGITIFCASAKRIYYNDNVNAWTASQRNQSDGTSFILINPRQIQDAEATIKYFLTRLTGPIAQPITLRISSSDGGNLQSTINEIGKIIRIKIMGFARASGLITSVRQFEQRPWNSTISENWFTEGLIQGSLLLCDLVRIGEEVCSTIDRYFDRYNMTLHKELLSRKTMKSFKFLSIINDPARFNEKLFKCLLSTKNRRNLTFFYLDQTLVNLIKDSPDSNVKTFKFNLEPTFSYFTPNNGTSNEKLNALLCHSLVKRTDNYDDCIKELRRLVACVSLPRQNSREIITHRTPFAKPWLTAIEDLSDCKIYINEDDSAIVRCNFDQKLPKTTTRRVKYIYEKILDRRISKRSPLRRVANELGNVLSRSRWGRQFIYDVCQYFTIYQDGRRKLNTLSKNYAKDKQTTIRYKKISVSLDLYKNGVLRKTMFAIGNFHRSALAMQKFLISSFKESWQTQILVCLSKWMMKLLKLFGYTNLDDIDVDIDTITDVPLINMTDSDSAMISDDIYDKNDEMKHLVIHRKKDQIRKETDEAFDRLVRSMNHVNRVQNRNSKTTLACLANNLLLVTMFMETISFVSTLFCLGEHTDESNFEDLEEE